MTAGSGDTPPGPPSDRTRLRRLPERGAHDRPTIDAILDEALIGHVAFTYEGAPAVIPTAVWRMGDRVYFHGSAASRMLRGLRADSQGGAACCVCVTLLDGLVLARSAFHHSMNYRSVVVCGSAVDVTGPAEKLAALEVFTEKVQPGRWAEVRLPTEQELKATTVLSLSLAEASAKVRTGPPVDDEADYAHDVWAGVVPLALRRGELGEDPRMGD